MNIQGTALIRPEHIREWLAEYGFSPDDVASLYIEIGWREPLGVTAWMEVDWYRKDEQGYRYRDPVTDDAARGHSTVPLHSFPALTPVSVAE